MSTLTTDAIEEAMAYRDQLVSVGFSVQVAGWTAYMTFTGLTPEQLPILETR